MTLVLQTGHPFTYTLANLTDKWEIAKLQWALWTNDKADENRKLSYPFACIPISAKQQKMIEVLGNAFDTIWHTAQVQKLTG